MMPCRRLGAPPVLVDHGERWTKNFVARRTQDEAAGFNWPTHETVPLNHHLRPLLLAMTAHHCAYCDHFELGVDGSRATIDHYRPKGDRRFWALAFAWENLFPSCDLCQEHKGEDFREEALAPDDASFQFERFFVVNFSTGEVRPSPAASADDQRRAAATIEWLGLNRPGLPARRRNWYERTYAPRKWFKQHPPLDELPYRFLAPPT